MHNSTKTFAEEILDQMGLFLAATFGLIVALAWNDAIRRETIDSNTRKKKINPWTFALIVTLIAIVLMAMWATFVATRLYPRQGSFNPKELFQNVIGSGDAAATDAAVVPIA